MTWGDLLDQWRLIEADLADAGVDLGDPKIRRRSWRWGRLRIEALLTAPPIGWRQVPVDGSETAVEHVPMFRYRIQVWARDRVRRGDLRGVARGA